MDDITDNHGVADCAVRPCVNPTAVHSFKPCLSSAPSDSVPARVSYAVAATAYLFISFEVVGHASAAENLPA